MVSLCTEDKIRTCLTLSTVNFSESHFAVEYIFLVKMAFGMGLKWHYYLNWLFNLRIVNYLAIMSLQ